METRNQAANVTQILRSGHELKSLQQFCPVFFFANNTARDLVANRNEAWLLAAIMM